MHVNQFVKQQDAKAKPVYVIFGPDEFLVQKAREVVRRQVFGDADAASGEVELDGRECSLGDCLEELQTMSLFSARRLVWVRNAGVLVRDNREGLLKYAESPCPTGILALLLEEFKTNTKVAKALAKVGALVECKPPYENQMPGRLATRARSQYGKTLSHAAAEMLAEYVGNDLAAADEELKKLDIYTGDCSEISEDDIEALVTRSRQEGVFALGDALADRDCAASLSILGNLLAEGMVAPQIIGALRAQFSKLLRAKTMSRRMSLGDVASRFPVPYRFRERFVAQIRRFSVDGLMDAYDLLAEADLASKTSSGSDRAILERFVLALCTSAQAQPTR
ncbi:MAG: DNA polymerase III subunit delta [Planctomycetia bacterium]|nr:DNA polymerase III subunit delta [Planctomycetia bacterium]